MLGSLSREGGFRTRALKVHEKIKQIHPVPPKLTYLAIFLRTLNPGTLLLGPLDRP